MPSLKEHTWNRSYKTSSVNSDGTVPDILHDFYVPILSHATVYDRVAGYFSSSSLAIASSGFSRFVNSGGKARFIVGTEMKQADAEAVLKGDSELLGQTLNKVFANDNQWPKEETNGIALLSWMVAHGFLEIKVAIRVHQHTGDVVPWEYQGDGYVHEKWMLFSDGQDWMHVSGSLNESKTALVINAENLEIHCAWKNEENAERVEEGQESFERLWQNKHPCIQVFSLPEAVKNKLLTYSKNLTKLVEIDGTIAIPDTSREERIPPAIDLLRFAVLRNGPKMPDGGLFVGMETAPVEPWPHQRVVARRLLERWPANHMLCDEVGLGKTIEAGLALRSLYLSGQAERIMVAAPASLTQQWHREMAYKFFLPFSRLSGPGQHEIINLRTQIPERDPLYQGRFSPNLLIASTGLFYRKNFNEKAKFDITLIDEAHKARRRNPTQTDRPADYSNFYRALNNSIYPNSRSLWLATATPMQLHPIEITDHLRMMPHAGPTHDSQDFIDAYYRCLAKVTNQENLSPDDMQLLQATLEGIFRFDKNLWDRLLQDHLNKVDILPIQSWIERGVEPPGGIFQRHRMQAGQQILNYLVFLRAAAPLSRVMLRHNRRLLELYRKKGELTANLATRHVYAEICKFNAHEQVVYDGLEKYCLNLAEKLSAQISQAKGRAAIGFYLSFLRLRFASSIYALKQTLNRRLVRVEETIQQLYSLADTHGDYLAEGNSFADLMDSLENQDDVTSLALKNREPDDLKWEREALEILIDQVGDLTDTSSKTQFIFEKIQERMEGKRVQQMVIFTRFTDSMNNLVDRIRMNTNGLLIGTFSGNGGVWFDESNQRHGVDRQQITQKFIRKEIDILICTDAAAEGLNLQTADLLINYDLPWNPMLVEQRIGRIDRIGQLHNHIQVFNLCYQGSAEEVVYKRLLDRLACAEDRVGEQQISLLPITEDDFAKLAAREITEAQLEVLAKGRLKNSADQRKLTEQNVESLYDIYQKEAARHKTTPIPVRLADIWDALTSSTHLKDLGCEVISVKGEQALAVVGIAGIADGTLLTTSRLLYEKGLAEGDPRHLAFATYGNPDFESLQNYFSQFPVPETVQLCEENNTVLLQAVNQNNNLVYIRNYGDIPPSLGDNHSGLSNSDLVDSCKAEATKRFDNQKLYRDAEKQFHDASVRLNILIACVAIYLLEQRSKPTHPFNQTHKNMENFLAEKRRKGSPIRCQIKNHELATRVELMESLASLYSIQRTASIVEVTAGNNLLDAALDLMLRESYRIKGVRATITVGRVISRLESYAKGMV